MRWLRTSLLAAASVAILAQLNAAEPSGWKAGVAVKVITPDQPQWMAGYGARNKPAEGKLQDLHVKALALEDPSGQKVVLLTSDLVGISHAQSDAVVQEVMKKTGGKWPGTEPFVAMLASLKVDAVRGPVSFDELRNPVENIYIKKVEKKKMFGYDKPELWNTVIKTYPNVGQFWKYDKATFLKQPVYSRDFPPCKFCE